jgi:hypothetical protein
LTPPQTIASINNRFKSPSLAFEDTGRFIAIAVLFGLTIVFSIGAALLSLRVAHPKWASTFVALLWLFVALLMLLGVGLMQGVHVVGKDTCLYVETYAVEYATTKVDDPQKKEWVSGTGEACGEQRWDVGMAERPIRWCALVRAPRCAR